MSTAEGEQMATIRTDGGADPANPNDANRSSGNTDLSSGNIDKIRDIIFGNQMRDYEKRFNRLEERLLNESADLRDDIKKRFDVLESYVTNELLSLNDRLKIEQDERVQVVQGVSQELKDTANSLERKLSQLDDQTTRAQREIRQQMLEQSKSLSDEIRQKVEALSSLVQREMNEVRIEKTDRSALASLFTELAMRLNNEFKIPGDA